MSVPDRICGLEVEYRKYGTLQTWTVETPDGQMQIVDSEVAEMVTCNAAVCESLEEAAEMMRQDILELAEECRAFADKVLGER